MESAVVRWAAQNMAPKNPARHSPINAYSGSTRQAGQKSAERRASHHRPAQAIAKRNAVSKNGGNSLINPTAGNDSPTSKAHSNMPKWAKRGVIVALNFPRRYSASRLPPCAPDENR